MIEISEYRPQIEAALKHGGDTHTFEDVVKMVEEGKAQFWPMPMSVIITEITEYPRKRVLQFWLAGGRVDELERAYPLIEQWGREQGCTAAAMVGRPGWSRSFLTKREGWRVVPLAVFEKTLHGKSP